MERSQPSKAPDPVATPVTETVPAAAAAEPAPMQTDTPPAISAVAVAPVSAPPAPTPPAPPGQNLGLHPLLVKLQEDIKSWCRFNRSLKLQTTSVSADQYAINFTIGPANWPFKILFTEEWKPMVSFGDSILRFHCPLIRGDADRCCRGA